jgi:hypothetical protein
MAKQPEEPNGRTKYTFRFVELSWPGFILGIAIIALGGVWLYLSYKIITGAIGDAGVRDEIEGLLTALAVLTIPLMTLLTEMMRRYQRELKDDNEK